VVSFKHDLVTQFKIVSIYVIVILISTIIKTNYPQLITFADIVIIAVGFILMLHVWRGIEWKG